MSGLEVVFSLVLFLMLAPLATWIGIVVCGYVTVWFLDRFYKEELKGALDNFSKTVAKSFKESME